MNEIPAMFNVFKATIPAKWQKDFEDGVLPIMNELLLIIKDEPDKEKSLKVFNLLLEERNAYLQSIHLYAIRTDLTNLLLNRNGLPIL